MISINNNRKADRIKMLHTISYWCYTHHLTLISILIRIFIRIIFSADVPYQLKIGKGTRFPHDALGSLFHQDCIIGENCTILHGVTIGGRAGHNGLPIIKDWCWIGTHSILLGDITIGEHSIIGAGSVVVKDVPPYSVVAGNPAKVLRTLPH